MDKQILGIGPATSLIKRYVQQGKAVGIAAYAQRGGKVLHRQYEGYADREAGRPIADDTIYRIYSMSKVVTAVAVMQLYEQGLFSLYDPVSDFLPALKDHKVFEEVEPGKVEVVQAKRPVTMRDLFTMTSGIPYPGEENHTSRAMRDAYIDKKPRTGREIAQLIGQVPLAFHPGDRWMYGFSIDVLGMVLEEITSMRLGEYLKENVTGPLGMEDTGFFLTEEQLPRLSALYIDKEGTFEAAKAGEGAIEGDPCVNPPFHGGGGGLFSTLDDYMRFAQMLVRGGTLDGQRIIGRKTIDLMRQNHLTPEQRAYCDWASQRGYGYGLGVRTRVDSALAGSNGSIGEWGWDGMAGTWFCVDPAEELIMAFMVQRVPGGHDKLVPPFMATVYGAI